VESIRLPEHAFTEAELVELSWKLQGVRITILYFCLFFLAAMIFERSWHSAPIAYSVCFFAFVFVVLLYRFVRLPKMLRARSNANAYKLRTLEFNAGGIATSAQDGLTAFTPWSYVVSGRILDKFILLYIAQIQFIAIPKRLLSTTENDHLVRLITSKVTPVKVG